MEPKVRAIVSHITIIGWVVAVATNSPKDELASFYIRQVIGIYLLGFASSFVMIIPLLGWIIGMVGFIAAFVFWIISLIGSLGGEQKLIPLIGDKFQDWFKAL